jgi:hypothetical protein
VKIVSGVSKRSGGENGNKREKRGWRNQSSVTSKAGSMAKKRGESMAALRLRRCAAARRISVASA